MPKAIKKSRAVPALTKGKSKKLTIEQAKSAVRKCLRGCRLEDEALKRLAKNGFKAAVVLYRDKYRKIKFTVHFKVPGQKKVASFST